MARARARLAALTPVILAPACSFWGMSDWSAREGELVAEAGAAVDGEGASPDAELPLVQDAFERVVEVGLGEAEIGGAWVVAGGGADVSVRDGHARLLVDAAKSRGALLPVTARDVDEHVTVSAPRTPNGPGVYLSLRVRVASSGLGYGFDLRITDANVVQFALKRASEVTLVNQGDALAGYAPGKIVHMRLRAEGASPTRLRGRAWLDETDEPSTWSLEAEDAEAAYQSAGSLGFSSYVSAASTSGAVETFFDDFLARALP